MVISDGVNINIRRSRRTLSSISTAYICESVQLSPRLSNVAQLLLWSEMEAGA